MFEGENIIQHDDLRIRMMGNTTNMANVVGLLTLNCVHILHMYDICLYSHLQKNEGFFFTNDRRM